MRNIIITEGQYKKLFERDLTAKLHELSQNIFDEIHAKISSTLDGVKSEEDAKKRLDNISLVRDKKRSWEDIIYELPTDIKKRFYGRAYTTIRSMLTNKGIECK